MKALQNNAWENLMGILEKEAEKTEALPGYWLSKYERRSHINKGVKVNLKQ